MILGQKSKRLGRYLEAIEHFSELFLLEQGRLIPDTAMVGEGQVGFSDEKPMATCNILQCSIVILRENNSAKAALMHVNKNTDVSEVKGTIAGFAKKFLEDKEASFSVRLVGSKFDGYSDEGSAQNLAKVLSSLPKDMRIISADVWEDPSPKAIVYYPDTDELIPGVGFELNEKAARMQRALSYIDLHKLALPKRAPLKTMPISFDLLWDEKVAEFSTSDIPRNLLPSCTKYGEAIEEVARSIFFAICDKRSNDASNRDFFLMRCLLDCYCLKLRDLSEKTTDEEEKKEVPVAASNPSAFELFAKGILSSPMRK